MTAIDSPLATYNNLSRVFMLLRSRNHQGRVCGIFINRPQRICQDDAPEMRDFYTMESSIDFIAVRFPKNR
jgi:hypothetical protein